MRIKRVILLAGLALTTPLLEKNPLKSAGFIKLALPMLGAIERVPPSETIGLAKTLVSRFGVGSLRQLRTPLDGEPSKYDDHRDDAPIAPTATTASVRRKAA